MSASPEQREFPRIAVDSVVVYTVGGSETIHHGRARNLSSNGILFTTPHSPEAGALLDVHMRSSPGRIPSLHAAVEVTRVTADGGNGHFQVAARIRDAYG